MPRFEKGNKLAKGGTRPGAGRKPIDREEILREVEQIKLTVDHADGEGPRPTGLLFASFLITAGIANAEFAPIMGTDREGEECVLDDGSGRARVQLAACRLIQERFLGKPAVSVEFHHTGGVALLQKLESYPPAVIDTTAREISADTVKPAHGDAPAKTRRVGKGRAHRPRA